MLDITDYGSLNRVHEEVSSIVGDHGLNLLVNNAGIGGKFLRIGFLKPEAMINTLNINTVAPVMLTKVLVGYNI